MTADGNCIAPETLAAWVDGELTANDSLRVEAHLLTCESCRSKAERMRGLGSSLKRLGSPAPDAEFVRGVQRRMATASAPARSPARAWPWVGSPWRPPWRW